MANRDELRRITVFDTAIGSENLGDLIIMDSVWKILRQIFPNSFFLNAPTHEKISNYTYKKSDESFYSFVGGTNLLSSNMNSYHQWNINIIDSLFLEELILMGVGWWQYQKEPNIYTRVTLRNVLSENYLHSVRDEYTENKLNSIGFENVIYTACPTMWGLDKRHCKEIAVDKAESALLTFTSYKKDAEKDAEFYRVVADNYKDIYFWPQGAQDYDYGKKIIGDEVEALPPTLEALDELLGQKEVDYVGTRLHGGIRALEHQQRSLILAVDNRAKEIAASTNLPVVERSEPGEIEGWINSKRETDIDLPTENIRKWKSQFS